MRSWRGKPSNALLPPFFGQLVDVLAKGRSGGLNPDDAALWVQGDDVDDTEEILSNALYPPFYDAGPEPEASQLGERAFRRRGA